MPQGGCGRQLNARGSKYCDLPAAANCRLVRPRRLRPRSSPRIWHRDRNSLPPVKIHCSVLAEDAIKAAIRDYREKNKRVEAAE